MSAIIQKFLHCDGKKDGCEETFGVDSAHLKIQEHRRLAKKKYGWIYVNGKDFCAVCKDKISPEDKKKTVSDL